MRPRYLNILTGTKSAPAQQTGKKPKSPSRKQQRRARQAISLSQSRQARRRERLVRQSRKHIRRRENSRRVLVARRRSISWARDNRITSCIREVFGRLISGKKWWMKFQAVYIVNIFMHSVSLRSKSIVSHEYLVLAFWEAIYIDMNTLFCTACKDNTQLSLCLMTDMLLYVQIRDAVSDNGRSNVSSRVICCRSSLFPRRETWLCSSCISDVP